MRLLHTLHLIDVRAFFWFNRKTTPNALVGSARVVSATADGYLYLLVGLGLALGEQWQILTVLASALAVERVLYFALKNKLRRNRPQQAIPGFRSVIQPSDQFSFPSGHTSAAFLFATVISAFAPVLLPALLVWAVCVGFSRVILGVHFPTDTLAGATLGTLTAYSSLSLIV